MFKIKFNLSIQTSNGIDDPRVDEAIVISLRAEIEEREKQIEQESSVIKPPDSPPNIVYNNSQPSSSTTAATTVAAQNSDQNQLSEASASAVNNGESEVAKETPRFKKSSLSSHGRNYRKRSHEED